MTAAWHITRGEGPLLAAAIHAGHELREELLPLIALSSQERLHEEDPFTDAWTLLASSRIVVARSRFELDLNRPRERAVYLTPEDAWDLHVWRGPLPPDVLARSLDLYDAFYTKAASLIESTIEAHGFALVLDLHSYNHRRDGSAAPRAENPDINLGTGSLDRDRWGMVADAFAEAMRVAPMPDGPLDVRENVKFRGGWFPTWIHEQFGEAACALAIEVKKTFMDETTGVLDVQRHRAVGDALEAAAAAALASAREVIAR